MTALMERENDLGLMPPDVPERGQRPVYARLAGLARLVEVFEPAQIMDEMLCAASVAAAELWEEITAARALPRRLLSFGANTVTAVMGGDTAMHSLTALGGLVAWDLAWWGAGLRRLGGTTTLEIDGAAYQAVTLHSPTGYLRTLRIADHAVVLHTPTFKAVPLTLRRGDPLEINRPAYQTPDIDVLERALAGLRRL